MSKAQDDLDAKVIELNALPARSPDDYGEDAPHRVNVRAPPLTIEEWLSRDLPKPDYILGQWLATTTRALLTADTGLGKTILGLQIAMNVSAGEIFLHWQGHRRCNVLYIDGEMSRRLLRQRIADAATRLGQKPIGFHALSHEDVDGFAPLNTVAGQKCIENIITQIGRVDLVVFDSVMCLTVGDMKDEESWQQTLPWSRSLTKRSIGQLWINHTGHDASRGYGTKTREWQMDTVVHLESTKHAGADVSFSLDFRKARERTPANRADFQTVKVALLGNHWEHQLVDTKRQAKVSPLAFKFLEALTNVLASDQAIKTTNGQRAAKNANWKAEAVRMGLIDANAKDNAVRAMISKYRAELISANRAVGEGDLTWTL